MAIALRRPTLVAPTPAVRLFALPLLGVLLVALYVLVPKSAVVLYPATQTLDDTIELRADPGAVAVDPRGRRVPARVGYVVIDVLEQTTVRGRLPDPNARATGTLTLINRLGGVTKVPAWTLVASASGVRFQTTGDATLGETAGVTARVPIQALDPGEKGNLGRLEINRLIGPLAGRVAALNEEATAGGGQGSVPVVSVEDVARVEQAATERARVDALGELKRGTQSDELLLTDSVDSAVVEETLDRRIGDQVGVITYRLKTRVSAARVARGDLRQIVQETWHPAVPSGFFLPPAQLDVGLPRVAGRERGTVTLKVPVRAVVVQQVDAAAARDLVRGRSPDDARRALTRAFKLAAEPRVTVQPGWLGRAYRVEVALDLNPPASR